MFTNAAGCDSTAVLALTIKEPTSSTTTISNCVSYTWNGTTYSTTGSYTKMFTNAAGCDSTAVLALTIKEPTTSTTTISNCVSYTWNGETYTATGSYTKMFTNAAGCDSTAVLALTIKQPTSSTTTISNCVNYTWNGTNYTASGTYTYFMEGANTVGCDSTAVLNLTIKHTSTSSSSHTACDSYIWNGITYSTSGAYSYTTTNSVGCDSVASLLLVINISKSSEFSATACDTYELPWGTNVTITGDYTHTYQTVNNCDSLVTAHITINNSKSSELSATACDTYELPWGTNITVSGSYNHTYTTVNNCDSVVTANIVINNSTSSSFSATACDTYELPWGANVTVSGSYNHTYSTVNNCDSVVTANIVINNSTSSSFSATACDSYIWDGRTYTSTGDYTHTYQTVKGCDSVVTAHITINNSTSSSFSATACDTYELPWGTNVTVSGSYNHTYTTVNNCDSVVTANIVINNSTSSSFSATACDSYVWAGRTYTTTGDYNYTYQTVKGCDSVVTAHITINNSASSSFSATACDSYVWDSRTYTSTGDYTHTYQTVKGCDSVVAAHITINNSKTTSLNATVCDSYELPWGATVTVSGAYSHTYTTVNNCDSVVTANIVINNSTSSSFSATACDSYVWGGRTYTTTGDYTYTYSTVNACDSVVTAHITINNSTSSSFSATACDSYIWDGRTYTATGAYTHTYSTVNGCDSVITAHITINNSKATSFDANSCDAYELPWGTNVTVSGAYTHTYSTVNDCDSLVTVNVTINNSTTTSFSATACDSYNWDGRTYTESGDYNYTYSTVKGCDSVVTAHITINNSTSSSFSTAACDSYVWDGRTYTATGAYTHTYSTVNGCDSVVTAHITINNSTSSSFNASTCISYMLPWGENVTVTGTYTHTYQTVNGCDSVVTANIQINDVASSSISETACNSYLLPWGENVTVTGTYVHTYQTVNGCDSVVTANIVINYSSSSNTEIVTCDSYDWHGMTFTTSGIYTFDTTNVAGCDSLLTLDLTIKNSTTSTMDVEACGSFTLNSQTWGVSGTYVQHFTNIVGCDSTLTINLTINNSLPPSPGSIYGIAELCPYVNQSTPVTYYVNTAIGAASYSWFVPAGATIVNGQGTNSIDIVFDNSLNTYAQIFVASVSTGGCVSTYDSMWIFKTIPSLGTISGTIDVCPYTDAQTTLYYQVDTVTNVTNYIWEVPAGATIVEGQGTNIIGVQFSNSFVSGGYIKVAGMSNCGIRASRVLRLYKLITSIPTAISGPTNSCPYYDNGNVATYSVPTQTYATSYVWTLPNTMTLVSGQGTNTITVTFDAGYQSSYIKVKAVNNCSSSSDRQLFVTAYPYAIPGVITGNTNACAYINNGVEATYTIRKVTGVPAYIWTAPAGMTLSHLESGENDTIVKATFDDSFVSGSNLQVQTTGCNTSAARSLTILKTITAAPTVLVGATDVCAAIGNQTAVTYYTSPVTNATSYEWTVPSGASILSGQGDTLITVLFDNTFTTGAVTVKSSTYCGQSAARSLTVGRLLPVTPTVLNGTTDIYVCTPTSNAGNYTYSTRSVTYANSYAWTVPTGATLVSGQGDTSIVVRYDSTFVTGSITVKAQNGCFISAAKTLTVTKKLPLAPTVLNGSTDLCTTSTNVAYTTTAVTNASYYIWSVPAGATIIAGQGTTAVTANFGNSFVSGTNISLYAASTCGVNTATKTLTVYRRLATTPTVLTGSADVYACSNTSTYRYTTKSTAYSTSYSWTVPTGATIVSGQGDTSILVSFDSAFVAGIISVKAVNACSMSAVKTFAVSKKLPLAPTVLTGTTDVCSAIGSSSLVTYTTGRVANASYYIWSVPRGASIVSGQGDTSIKVRFDTSFVSGTNITVKAASTCGVNNTAKSFTITKSSIAAPTSISGPASACGYYGNGVSATYSISAVTNAVSYSWTVPAYATILTGQGTTSITVRFDSGYVTSSIKVKSVSGCGVSADKALSVTAVPYAKPGTITGSTNACGLINTGINTNYTIRKVANAPAYLWTVPTGVTLLSHPAGLGANDTIIRVRFDSTFVVGSSIQVSTTGCTNSLPSSLVIGGSISATPGTLSGLTTVCEAMQSTSNPNGTAVTYTIRKVTGATSYIWAAPTNATIASHPAGLGTNDTIVTVIYSSSFISGSVTVKSANYCGNSASSSLAIARSVVTAPGTITTTVVSNTCPNRVYKYSLRSMPSNATALIWNVPAGGTITAGQGTLTITVSYATTAIAGNVSVQSSNNCSASSLSLLALNLAACAGPVATPVLITKSAVQEVEPSIKNEMVMNVYPNPSNANFNIKVSGGDLQKSLIRVLDMMGRVVKVYNVNENDKFTFGNELKAGNYILEVTKGTSKTTKRIIKL
jgi:NADH:ubiquinone oxidoreductase subunit B-like Fe-S oxidoreductase